MKKAIIKKIILNNNEINIDNKDIRDGFDKREWKTIIFTKYVGDVLEYRDNIHVKFIEDINFSSDEEVELFISARTVVGKGRFSHYDNDGYAVIKELDLYINSRFNHVPNDLVRLFNENELNERGLKYKTKVIIADYIKGLFKIYYKMLDYSVSNLSENVENKYSAMCAYLAVRDCFKEYGINLSYPNCFIKGYKLEYDALILKNPSNKYFHDLDNVLATIEIKVCGVFFKSTKLKDKFRIYMQKQHGIDIEYKETENAINNIKIKDRSKELNIPHIYITAHESSSNNCDNKDKIRFYDECYNAINELGSKYVGIFCTLKNQDEQFVIPIDYDLKEILKANDLIK